MNEELRNKLTPEELIELEGYQKYITIRPFSLEFEPCVPSELVEKIMDLFNDWLEGQDFEEPFYDPEHKAVTPEQAQEVIEAVTRVCDFLSEYKTEAEPKDTDIKETDISFGVSTDNFHQIILENEIGVADISNFYVDFFRELGFEFTITPYDRYSYQEQERRRAYQTLIVDDTTSLANLPLFAPTTRELRFAYTSLPNKKAYIVPGIQAATFELNEDGQIATQLKDKEPKENNLDLILMRQFAGAIQRSKLDGSTREKVIVDLEEFADSLNIDLKNAKTSEQVNERLHALLDKLEELRKARGVWERSRLIDVLNYELDLKNKTITFSSPYTEKVIEEGTKPKVKKQLQNIAVKEEPKPVKAIPSSRWLSDSINPKIHEAQNKPCVDIVLYIATRLELRGNVPDSKMPGNKYLHIDDPEGRYIEISITELLKNCPEFYYAFNKATEGRLKSQVIKRALYGRSYKNTRDTKPILVEFLEKYTDFHKLYKNFVIALPPNPPSYKELNQLICIVHQGEDRKYKRNKTMKYKTENPN